MTKCHKCHKCHNTFLASNGTSVSARCQNPYRGLALSLVRDFDTDYSLRGFGTNFLLGGVSRGIRGGEDDGR